jgi:hypothetical protein
MAVECVTWTAEIRRRSSGQRHYVCSEATAFMSAFGVGFDPDALLFALPRTLPLSS